MSKWLLAGMFLLTASGIASAAERRIGPSYPCSKAAYADGLTRMICESPDLSREEMSFAQVYFVRRFGVDNDGRKLLKEESRAVSAAIRNACGMPKEGAPDQTMPVGAAACYIAETEKMRMLWLQLLHGAALEEAARPVEQNIDSQQRLADLGFLPMTARADGVFGDTTRSAITTWQRVSHRPEVTGFLSDDDNVALRRPDNGPFTDHLVSSTSRTVHENQDQLDASADQTPSAAGEYVNTIHGVDNAVRCFKRYYVRGAFSSTDDNSTGRLNHLCSYSLTPIKTDCATFSGANDASPASAFAGAVCDMQTNTLATMFLREEEHALQTIDGQSVLYDLIETWDRLASKPH